LAAAVAQRSSGAGTTESVGSSASSVTTAAMGSSVAAGSGLVVAFVGFNSTLPSISNVRSNKDGTTNFSAAVAVTKNAAGEFVGIYYLPNTAGGSGLTVTVTFAAAVTEVRAVAFECTGVPTDSTFFDTSTTNSGTSNAPSTGSVTAGANAQLVFAAITNDSSANPENYTGTGSGYTRGGQNTDGTVSLTNAIDFKASASIGGTSVSDSWSTTSTIAYQACVATFNVAGGGSTTPSSSDSATESDGPYTIGLGGISQGASESESQAIGVGTTDTASEAEQAAINLLTADTAAFAEQVAIAAAAAGQDSAALGEQLKIALQATDGTALGEQMAIALANSDSATLSELVSVALAISDTAAATEQANVSAQVGASDSATLGESASQSASGGSSPSATQGGTATEQASVGASLSTLDAAALAEQVAVALGASQGSTLAEQIALGIGTVDSAALVEQLQVLVAAAATDGGAVAELQSLVATLIASEAISFGEAASVMVFDPTRNMVYVVSAPRGKWTFGAPIAKWRVGSPRQ
jgi:hypothetical protein